jgi:hypothetical protein
VSRVGKNSDPSTNLGGEARSFPTTQGSWIGDLGSADSYRRAIDLVCRRYWKPIYWFVRFTGTRTNEEAKDFTQAFLVWLLEDEPLRDYQPSKGRFRPFLKILLKRFLGHEEEAKRRLKRGGAVRVLALDDPSFPGEGIPDSRTGDPEQAFDRLWAADGLTWADLQAVCEQRPCSFADLYKRVQYDLPDDQWNELGDWLRHCFRQLRELDLALLATDLNSSFRGD